MVRQTICVIPLLAISAGAPAESLAVTSTWLKKTWTAQSSAQQSPLALPPSYDPEVSLVSGGMVEGRVYHSTHASRSLAAALVANGTPQDLQVAEKILGAILACQELRPDDPHYGNFRWVQEESMVEDLNAVQFVMFSFIPMMIEHGDRLSPPMRKRVLESIRLALDEIRRMDVHFMYTNIVMKDMVNSILGGELLKDEAIAKRGYKKFTDWMTFTDRSGGAYEYNSPTYTAVATEVVSQLARLVKDEPTRIRARIVLARLGLSAALHIHPLTGLWAGPHGRAYHATVAGIGQSRERFRGWIDAGTLPAWLSDAAEMREPMQVIETTDAEQGIGTSTYHGQSFSLGVATRELSNQINRFIAWQSNLFTVGYSRDGQVAGTVFSRYQLDDEWYGDFQSTPSRPPGSVIPERGWFHGVQDRERALCLYTSPEVDGITARFSAKTVVAWPQWGTKDELWIGTRRLQSTQAPVPEGSTVVVVSGDVMTAIRPLGRTGLGTNAPLRIRRMSDGTLLFEMYNYLGPRKTFWELARGAFYQGTPKNGFYAEVSERSKYRTGGEFAEAVASGKLTDVSDAPFTSDGRRPRLWKTEYSRDGRSLGVEVDLMNWAKPARRWTNQGEAGRPMLESPIARQSRGGNIEVKGAVLTCGRQPAWLFVSPKRRFVVAAYHGPEAAPLKLELPEGSVELESIGAGMVTWDAGQVTVEGIGIRGTPKVAGGRLALR
jgi:hypothetical protein